MNLRLRELREDNDLTQIELGRILNCSQTGYAGYEIGTRGVPLSVLEKLADFYNTSVDYLLGRTDEYAPYPKSKRTDTKSNLKTDT